MHTATKFSLEAKEHEIMIEWRDALIKKNAHDRILQYII